MTLIQVTYIQHFAKSKLQTEVAAPVLNKSYTFDINIALVIYKLPLRYISMCASPVWDCAAETYVNRLQTIKSRVLGIITNLTRVTPIEKLHKQTGVSLITTHVNRTARELHQKPLTIEKRQIQVLGYYGPIGDKYLLPLSLQAIKSGRYVSRKQCLGKQLAEIDQNHCLNSQIVLVPNSPAQILEEQQISLKAKRLLRASQWMK